VYNKITEAVKNEPGGLCFLEASGGTGKTFFISLILTKVRSYKNIALTITSFGIEATLLDGGITTHSAFKLPLNLHVQETPTCNIKKFQEWPVLKKCQIKVC
jgi:ATP-dependent DNA helicase PIF1